MNSRSRALYGCGGLLGVARNREVLGAFVGPQRRVSWGTIYPLFERSQKEGLIKAVARSGSQGGREKQSYTITSAGRKRFHELMKTEPPYDPDYRETFRIKLGHFSRVEPEVRRNIAHAYMDRLRAIQNHTAEMYKLVQEVREMEEDEREMILRAIRHERSLAQAEVSWMKKEMAELRAE